MIIDWASFALGGACALIVLFLGVIIIDIATYFIGHQGPVIKP